MNRNVYVCLPLDVLDGIWPTGVTLLSRRERSREEWIDTLDAEVDRGLLRRVGDGTKDSPYRYEETMPGIFTTAVSAARLGLDHPTTQRLLSRLGLRDAG